MLAKGVLGSHWLLLLTLHHSLGELHQPHSIFRLWENPITHAPLMASPSVSLTAPLPNQAFPWPGWPHHLVVTGCLCHKGSRTLHKTSRTKKPYQQSLNMLKRLVSPVTCQKRVAWLACHLSGWLGFTCHLTPASLQNTACHLALKAWLGFILSQLGMLKRFCCIAFANSIYKFTFFFFFSKKFFEEFFFEKKRLVSPVTCQKRVAWLACHLSGWLGFTCHLTPASFQNTACHLALKAWLGFILSQLGMLKRFCCIAFANSIYKFTFFFFQKNFLKNFFLEKKIFWKIYFLKKIFE